MNFKEQLENDLDIFLNIDEFAEIHSINGIDIVTIVDNDLLEEKSKLQGVYLGDILFFAKTSDLNFLPENKDADLLITFDNQSYKVVSRSNEDGLTTIILSGDEGLRFITVKYRSSTGTGGNSDLGIPSTKISWASASTIIPNPVIEEIKTGFNQEQTGIVKEGDIKLKIDKDLFTRSEIESYEFLINEKEYTAINGKILEENYFWILYLRMIQQ